jgi:hypothetical protein
MTDGKPMNLLQRWHRAKARPYYERLPEALRDEAWAFDQYLLSRHSAGLWLGMAGAIGGSTLGLGAAGFPLLVAVFCSATVWIGVASGALGAWVWPERFTARRFAGLLLAISGAAYGGALVGMVAARLRRGEALSWPALQQAMVSATPLLLLIAVAVPLMLLTVSWMRREQTQRMLERVNLMRERDAAARQASEAQLRLLRAQIQPHFIFNTLSAVQHWVDTGDARASGLLRELTGFLRGSTELLSRPEVTLREEAVLLQHYLAIMQARLGERLRFGLQLAPAALAQPLPPGLLVTLAENAVEHGVVPSLQGGAVQVEAHCDDTRFELVVRNTGQALAPGWRDGVGLANIRERLRHQFGARARLSLESTPEGTEARVTISAIPA